MISEPEPETIVAQIVGSLEIALRLVPAWIAGWMEVLVKSLVEDLVKSLAKGLQPHSSHAVVIMHIAQPRLGYGLRSSHSGIMARQNP